jgi:hypothetical protein
MSISMMTETTMPPGLLVSWQPTHTPLPVPGAGGLAGPGRPPLTLTLTVVLWLASRRPELGATDSLPIRPDDSVADHDTGPPEAVSVTRAPDSALITIVRGATLSVPGAGGGAGVVLLAEGTREPGGGPCRGDGLWLGAGLWLDEGAEGEDDRPPPPGVVPPADGDGATWAAAPAVAFAELPAPLHKAERWERPPQKSRTLGASPPNWYAPGVPPVPHWTPRR